MKIKWRVRSSSKAINNCWEWGEGKEFYNHHRPPGFVLPQMDRWSWCEEGLNHNCHLTSSSIQTSRRTSFCPIKPDPGLSSTYNWAIIGQASIGYKSTLWLLLLMFYYPNEFFFHCVGKWPKMSHECFSGHHWEWNKKGTANHVGFLLLIGDLFFLSIYSPHWIIELEVTLLIDTQDWTSIVAVDKRPKPVRKHSLLRVFLFLGLWSVDFLKKCWILSSYHTTAATTASLTLLYFTTQPKEELTVRKTSREDCHWRFYIQSDLCLLLLRFPLSSPPLFTFELPKYLCSTGSKTQSHVPSAYKWEEHLELERRLGMKPGIRKKNPTASSPNTKTSLVASPLRN